MANLANQGKYDMSVYDYREGVKLGYNASSFNALIMAAIFRSDKDNFEKLKTAFPEQCREYFARHKSENDGLVGEENGVNKNVRDEQA